MILTGENQTAERKTCPRITLPAINHTQNGLEMKQDLRGERPVTNCLSHGTSLISRSNTLWSEDTIGSHIKGQLLLRVLHRASIGIYNSSLHISNDNRKTERNCFCQTYVSNSFTS